MNFLLVKLGHLGDTLLLTPTLRFLREKYPDGRIDVIVRRSCEVVLQGNPDVDRVIPVARPEKARRSPGESLREFSSSLRHLIGHRYDYAIDLSGSDRARFYVALSGARHRGVNDVLDNLGWKKRLFNRFSCDEWYRRHDVLKNFQTVLDVTGLEGEPGPLVFQPEISGPELRTRFPSALEGDAPFALIHPTSRWAYKQWLPEHWARVADRLTEDHGLRIVLTSGPDPREIAEIEKIAALCKQPVSTIAGRTSVPELTALIGKARLFLGVDTVAMHLAAAMQAPTLALFGPSSEDAWRPWQTPHELVLGDCPCKITRKFICDKSKPYPCMESIGPGAVLRAAANLLEASR